MGKDFLLKVKHGVLQYVVVKTILTLLTTFLFLPSGLYGEGELTFLSFLDFFSEASIIFVQIDRKKKTSCSVLANQTHLLITFHNHENKPFQYLLP